MNWQNHRRLVAVGFYLSLAIMLGIGILSFFSTRDLIRYNKLLNRSLKVHQVLDRLRAFLVEAESGQRGYVLTGDDRFLISSRQEAKDISLQFEVLRSLTADRPGFQQHIDALEPLVKQKLALFQERIALLAAGNRQAAIRSIQSGVGLQLMDNINFGLNSLAEEENQVLKVRQAGVDSMRRRAALTRLIAGPLSFAILILIFYCLKREIAVRRRTAEALHLSEERLRVFMENSPTISFMKDAGGKYVYVNGLIEQLTSKRPAELVGRTDAELWPPEVAQPLQAMDRLVFSEEKSVEITTKLPGRENNPLDYLIYEFPIPNHKGQRLLGGVAVDITQRKAAEEALQKAAQEFRIVVNNIPAVVFKGYVDGTVDFFDARVELMTGYSREEFEARRRRWHDLIFPEDLETAKAAFVKALRGSGLYVREYRLRTKAEEVIWIQERSCILRQPDGLVDYISGVFFDITARKRGENALRESESRYRNIFDNAVEGIFQSTVQGRFISVNPAMAEMYGYESPEALMTAVTDIKHQVYVDPARRRDFQSSLERDGFVKDFEYEVYRRDHSTAWLSENARAVRDATGNLLYYEGFAVNITARRLAEKKLQRANRALKTLSAVNHALVDATDEDAFLKDICRIITAVGGYRLAWIALARHDAAQTVSPLAYAGIGTDFLENLNISWADNETGGGPTGTAIRTNQTAIVKDIMNDPAFAPWRDKILSLGLASVISLPLPLDGAPWCALTIYAPELNAFDSDEVDLLEELAQDIQYGIISLRGQKARRLAEEALQESEEKFRGLFETSPDVVAQTDLDLNLQLFNRMAKPLFRFGPADQLLGRNFLDLVDPADHPRVLEDAQKLLAAGTLQNVQYTFVRKDGTSFPGEASATVTRDTAGAPKAFTGTIRDITDRQRMQEKLEEERNRLFAILEGLPVYVYLQGHDHSLKFVNRLFREYFGEPENRPCYATMHGRQEPCEVCRTRLVLETNRPQEWEWTAANNRTYQVYDYPFEDVDGSSLVMEIGMDITDRKQAEEALKDSYERLRASLQGTVTALSAVVESKDPYTAGHQQRVSELACAIAREMELNQDQLEGIRVMGYLHDIGKIAVPAEILSRPGKINEFEFNLIKQHPLSGFDILKQIAFPWPVAQAVFQHHERLNGSGYPSGVTDADIILEARVLAVADVVEAMASHRPYRPAVGITRALEEIVQNQDVLYDREVVAACVQLFSKKGFDFS